MNPGYAATLNKLFVSGERSWPDPLDLLNLSREFPALSADGMDSKYFGNGIMARFARRHATPVDEPDVIFSEFHRAYWWIKSLKGAKFYQPLSSIVIYANEVIERVSVGAMLAGCLMNDLKIRATGAEVEVHFRQLN